jgi:hypothetical protein
MGRSDSSAFAGAIGLSYSGNAYEFAAELLNFGARCSLSWA